jgi:hypothetical protein
MLALQACDGVFGITRLKPPLPDAPVDAAPDAPTMFECTESPIVLRPTGIDRASWVDQFPSMGTHLDHIAETKPDDDDSYIASAFDGELDLFTHVPLASTVTIESVTVWARARIEGTVASPQLGVAFSTATTLEWDDVAVGMSWKDHSTATYTQNPATTQPWTVDEVNALTFGVRKAYSNERVRVTQIWAEVACR